MLLVSRCDSAFIVVFNHYYWFVSTSLGFKGISIYYFVRGVSVL